MSEGETKGLCRREFESYYADKHVIPNRSEWLLADALDRLAADVAEIKARVNDISPEDVRHLLESAKAWVSLVEEKRDAAIRERDEARAEVERLRVELAARPAANSPGILDGSKPASGWLTEDDRHAIGLAIKFADLNMQGTHAHALRALLDRAGSPPVVEVPVLKFLGPMTGREQGIVAAYRDALDKAGVAWKEVPRE